MWQGSQNRCATQKESRVQHNQMTTIGYIMDTEELVKASWSLFQHDGVAAFILSERSPLPPRLSVNKLPGGWTQILNVRLIRRINHHPVKSAEDSAPETISDSEDCLNWNGDLENPTDSADYCATDIESGIAQDLSIEDSECPEQRDVSSSPNIPRLIGPERTSKRQAEKVLVTVNAIETRRNKGVKKK